MPEPTPLPLQVFVSMNVPARRPSLILQLGNFRTEMSVEQARRFGQQLIGLATEAEIQGFLLDWMTQHFGQFTVDQASTLAAQFRQYLAQQRNAKEPGAGPGSPPSHDDGPPPPADR